MCFLPPQADAQLHALAASGALFTFGHLTALLRSLASPHARLQLLRIVCPALTHPPSPEVVFAALQWFTAAESVHEPVSKRTQALPLLLGRLHQLYVTQIDVVLQHCVTQAGQLAAFAAGMCLLCVCVDG